jgi:hypothetical protein
MGPVLYIMCRDPLQKDRGGVTYLLRGVCVEMEGRGGDVALVVVVVDNMHIIWGGL